MEKEPITSSGLEKLKKELKELKDIRRPKIVQAIAEARGHGDLKENAEYHAAREHQGIVEAKIKDIEFKLGNSEIIENENNDSKSQIIFGSIVELLNTEDNTKIKYQLVGEDEADLTKNKISFNSPIAKGLLNKKIGDTITISVPKGELNFKVISIN